MKTYPQLPALEIAGKVNDALSLNGRVVVTAPPGAGKSTLLPLTILLGAGGEAGSEANGGKPAFGSGKIVMLEPRRVAARSIAERMADILGEEVGQTVGYRVRKESRVGRNTRIEVVTERILTRMISSDPTLDGISCIIFDEFHERSLDSDLGLALALECQKIVREDLRIVIMSATIDAESICSALGATLIESRGRMFPVDTIYSTSTPDPATIAEAVADKIREALRKDPGDILAFLPGEAEIRRCARLLGVDDDAPAKNLTEDGGERTVVMPLYGMLDKDSQRRAIAPSHPGERKIVLATPIAETSLTIEGVRVVVDGGLCRKMVFNPQSSMSRLETVRISMDMARQRCGRAGRTADGVCYRLWSKGTETQMKDCRTPEILDADLSPAALDVAAWGEGGMMDLQWLTPPPASHVKTAVELLSALGAIDSDGKITPTGRKMSVQPCHPRIAKMMVSATDAHSRAVAEEIAEILEERGGAGSNRGWKDPEEAGRLLALAYPERVAKAQGNGRFLLASGEVAAVDSNSPLAAYDYISVATLSSRAGAEGRIYLAAPVRIEDLMQLAQHRSIIGWDSRKGAVAAQEEWRIGRLVLKAQQGAAPDSSAVLAALAAAAPKDGLTMFDFSDEVQNLQRRIAAVASWHPELGLPDVSTGHLLETAAEWLPMYAGKASTVNELRKINLCTVIWNLLDYGMQQQVDRLAPSHITVPTGSNIKVEYRQGADAPVVKVRLQECFGLVDTPTVDGGMRKVLMELLSPGYKPVQLTSDLRSFWEGTYFEVRKELRLRYPKHSWPENPLEAPAIRGAVKRK